MKSTFILPTGNEIQNGVVLDLDSPEIMAQIIRQYPDAEVTRLCPLVDEEEAILHAIDSIVARAPDFIVLVGGSGGGHRHSGTLGHDFTHSALDAYLDQKSTNEIYGKNGHLWSKLVCGKKGQTLIINVPGPFQEAKAAIRACLDVLAKGGEVEEICRAMAEAVYSQYPIGAAEAP